EQGDHWGAVLLRESGDQHGDEATDGTDHGEDRARCRVRAEDEVVCCGQHDDDGQRDAGLRHHVVHGNRAVGRAGLAVIRGILQSVLVSRRGSGTAGAGGELAVATALLAVARLAIALRLLALAVLAGQFGHEWIRFLHLKASTFDSLSKLVLTATHVPAGCAHTARSRTGIHATRDPRECRGAPRSWQAVKSSYFTMYQRTRASFSSRCCGFSF